MPLTNGARIRIVDALIAFEVIRVLVEGQSIKEGLAGGQRDQAAWMRALLELCQPIDPSGIHEGSEGGSAFLRIGGEIARLILVLERDIRRGKDVLQLKSVELTQCTHVGSDEAVAAARSLVLEGTLQDALRMP